MTFGQPYFLILLALLPLLAWLKGRQGKPAGFVYSSLGLVKDIYRPSRFRSGALLAALRWLALVLFILALAQPRFTRSETRINASGIDIAVAIDLSGSMASEDFEVRGGRINRLDMAKRVLAEFVSKRPSDRIGLVAFATLAYTAAPLTLDHEFLLQVIDRLQLGLIDNSRTAIGSALSTAVNRVRDLPSKSRIVILMTDGQNNAGNIDPLNAAEAAQALGVKVYTIGVGVRGTAPMPVYVGGQKFYQQQTVDIDEETLQKIADLTGGKYYRADNAERFQSIYAEIDQLEKTEAEVQKFSHHRELFAWAIVPGCLILLLELLLRHTLLRRLP